MHEIIMDLKGNIRVFARARPSDDEADEAEIKMMSFPTKMVGDVGEAIQIVRDGKISTFKFDKVFVPESTQTDLFAEISQVIQSALDGYKVCIFAYGQTGSGKTHTMIGGSGDKRGLIPRSLEKIFEARQNVHLGVQVSIYEVYLSTIKDLLSDDDSRTLAVRDCDGDTKINGITWVNVKTLDQILDLLARARQKRKVMDDEHKEGVLTLADLAASESVDSQKEQLQVEEAKAINQSLAKLKDVILALVEREPHVRFRDSKLTQILKKYAASFRSKLQGSQNTKLQGEYILMSQAPLLYTIKETITRTKLLLLLIRHHKGKPSLAVATLPISRPLLLRQSTGRCYTAGHPAVATPPVIRPLLLRRPVR
ncbi:kinesin-like protein KIN-14N [Rutidosis leptorrhynchoides]|uniref:kinesin-like protein KIN-14N n=1 Tax=Rutidosis leptorrhynchoides TaxID=125765 RepID=UPI003A98FCEF